MFKELFQKILDYCDSNDSRIIFLSQTNDLSCKGVLEFAKYSRRLPNSSSGSITDRLSRILERRPSCTRIGSEWIDEAAVSSAFDVTWSSKDRFDNLLGSSFGWNNCSFKNIREQFKNFYTTFSVDAA